MDEDDVEFLDEVIAKKKAEEERLRRETEEGLKVFRERQKGGEDAGELKTEETVESETWGVGRKRKRKEREGGFKGLKRKVSEGEAEVGGKTDVEEKKEDTKPAEKSEPEAKKPALGLVDYGSDDSD